MTAERESERDTPESVEALPLAHLDEFVPEGNGPDRIRVVVRITKTAINRHMEQRDEEWTVYVRSGIHADALARLAASEAARERAHADGFAEGLRKAEEAVQHEIARTKASPLYRATDHDVANALHGAEVALRALAALGETGTAEAGHGPTRGNQLTGEKA